MSETEPSTVTTVDNAMKALVNLSGSALAKAVGLWTAARAAVSTVASGVAAAAVQATINAANAKYQGTPLSPPVLADMIVRNILPDSTGAAGLSGSGYPPPMMTGVMGGTATDEAAFSGLSGDRFAAMVYDTGESYGIVDALRMYNRGQFMYALVPGPNYSTGVPLYEAGTNLATTYGITEAELDKVIAYSRVRPEFTADLLKLAKNTLSPADAVEMAVKQIVPTDVAQSLFEAAGGVGEQFQALVDAAGDAAGVEKLASLRAHGYITQGQLMQGIGMSRINPRFYYLAEPTTEPAQSTETPWVPLNAHFLGAYEIGVAVANGSVSAAQALLWLKQQGYPTAQAEAFVGSKTATTTSAKAETEAMVLNEYQAGTLTEAQATTALEDLGYTKAAVPFILANAAAKMAISARNSAVARVKAAFLRGTLTGAQVKTDLGELNVPAAAIGNYLTDWTIESQTPSAHLSDATIGWLLEQGYITPAEAQTKWQASGLSAEDAALLLYRYPPKSEQEAG